MALARTQTSHPGIAFGRTGVFTLVTKALERTYGSSASLNGFPSSLLQDPMRLMPLTEMSRYFSQIAEQVNDPLALCKAGKQITLSDFSMIDNVVLSSPVLFTAIVQYNYLFSALHTGKRRYIEHTSQVFKWCYDCTLPDEARLQDSIVASWMFIHVIRHYHGKKFTPVALHLPGARIGKKGELEQLFGCPIVWHAKRAELWCEKSLLTVFSRPITLHSRSLPELNVMELLSKPDENDFARCVFEAINYARSFGYPKLDYIAQLMGLSPQALQRRLARNGMRFTELVKYQLMFVLAPAMLLEDCSVAEMAKELGYHSTQSFAKAFQAAHQLTPKQYLEQLDEQRGIIR